MTQPRRQQYPQGRLLDLLTTLEDSDVECLTAYVSPSTLAHPEALEVYAALPAAAREALGHPDVVAEAGRSLCGAALFWHEEGDRLIVLPPFPIQGDSVSRGRADTSPLRRLVVTERTVGVIAATWGRYAVGAFRGGELVASKVGTGHIHTPHRKGGRSERRFARRTEEQKKDFLRRVANRIEEQLRGPSPELICFAGNRLMLKPLLDECPYLKAQSHRIAGRTMAVRHPDVGALWAVLEQAYSSLVFTFE